ncbi:hypothetical protein B0A49_05097 [Cryomyces minteri]|uniref:Uncharacterized protein n=1 Tax=Cryomyces minteri TaxID=331657 RepID=A0A4V5NII2_9PEZI|nr:hypothetical protein B0A49_05097 [Cryomyces minteri]
MSQLHRRSSSYRILALYKKKEKRAPAPMRAPEAALTAVPAPEAEDEAEAEAEAVAEPDALLVEADAEDAPEEEAAAEEAPLEADPEAERVAEPLAAEPVADPDASVAVDAVPDAPTTPTPPIMEVALDPTEMVAVVLPLFRVTVLKPDERPAGMVTTAGCVVMGRGWEVTTVGMPVTTPSEFVWVRSGTAVIYDSTRWTYGAIEDNDSGLRRGKSQERSSEDD